MKFSMKPRTSFDTHVNFAELPAPLEYLHNQGFDVNESANNLWICCPFHDDTNPSLSMDKDTGKFNCFSCKASGGDVIAFHARFKKFYKSASEEFDMKAAAQDLGLWEESVNFQCPATIHATSMSYQTAPAATQPSTNVPPLRIYSTEEIEALRDKLQDKAKRMFWSWLDQGYDVMFYEYTDEHGQPIYWKARVFNPSTGKKVKRGIRPFKIVGEKILVGEPKPIINAYPAGGGKKPLYNLQAIANAPSDAAVYIVEGEKTADTLMDLSILATTSGGANSAKDAYWQPLAGRTVVIWRDFDEAGLNYQNDVIAQLKELGCHIEYVDVDQLDLNDADDAVDWIEKQSGVTSAEVYALPTTKVAAAPSSFQTFYPLVPFTCQESQEVQKLERLPAESPVLNEFPPPATPKEDRLFLRVDECFISEPDYLIDGYIERNTLSTIFGKTGAGKSFVAVAMAMCVASGQSFYGSDTKRGGVVYIAGEGHRGIMSRIHAFAQKNNIPIHNLPLIVSKQAVVFENDNAVLDVEYEIEQVFGNCPPSMIIIDTLARSFSGDENNTECMNKFTRMMDSLRLKYGCAVVIVHHTGKSESSQNTARGAIALKCNMDVELRVSQAKGTIKLQSTKIKDGESPEDKFFKLEPMKVKGFNVVGKEITVPSCVLVEKHLVPKLSFPNDNSSKSISLSAKQQLTYDALKAISATTPNQPVSVDSWRTHCVSNGMAKSTFKSAMDVLVGKSLVEINDNNCTIVNAA